MSNQGNIKLCKHCKSQIPSNAKVCPYCGKKQGGIVKKVAIGFVILMVIGAIGGNANDDEKPNLNPSNEIASKLEANEASKNNENSSQKVEDNQNDAQNSSQENEPQKNPHIIITKSQN